MALQGARDRYETTYQNHVVTAWLTGLLGGMADPKTYPKLETLIGKEKKTERTADPAEASNNARLWGMALRAANKKAAKG